MPSAKRHHLGYVILLARVVVAVLCMCVPASAKQIGKCGGFQIHAIQLTSSTMQLQLKDSKNTVVLKLSGAAVDILWCQDITADKVAEALFTIHAGGELCCTAFYLYTMSSPPRKLLEKAASHVVDMQPVQLDGKGAKELLSYDDRLLNNYHLVYQDSVFLPVVYRFVKGVYVEDTFSFPQIIQTLRINAEPAPYVVLSNIVAALLLKRDPEDYLETVPEQMQQWLRSYFPDIRQDLNGYGFSGYPSRAGVLERVDPSGKSGAFTLPGAKEYTTLVQGSQLGIPANRTAVVLFQQVSGDVVAKPVLVLPAVSGDVVAKPVLVLPAVSGATNKVWKLKYAVERSNKTTALVIENQASASKSLEAYSLMGGGAEKLQDALAEYCLMLASLSNLAEHNTTMLNKTPKERQSLYDRSVLYRSRVQPYLSLQKQQSISPETLADFLVYSIEMIEDKPSTAIIRSTVEKADVDLTQPNLNGMVIGKRYELLVYLNNTSGGWKVSSWTLHRLIENPYTQDL